MTKPWDFFRREYVASIWIGSNRCYTLRFMPHDEYDLDRWKEEL